MKSLFSAQTSLSKRLTLLLFVAVMLYLYMHGGEAHADDIGFPVLNRINDVFAARRDGWHSTVYGYAVHLFWLLVSVDFAWSGITYVLEKNDIGEITVSVTKKILTIGFFFAVLKFSGEWIPKIIDSFAMVGMAAGGSTASTPDGIAGVGFNLAASCFKSIQDLGALDKVAVIFPVTVVAIIMFLSYLFVAAQLLVTLIETYLAIGGGVILLGFGGSRWTTDLATKYLQYAVSTGLKLMMIYMIVGMGNQISGDLTILKDDLIGSCMKVMGVGLVYAYLAIQIPQIASAMISGSPSLTAGGFAGTALTLGASVAGGAAAAKAATAGAGGAMGGALAGTTGLGKALNSGFASAADFGKTGFDAAAHATGSVVGHGLGMATSAIGSALSGAAGTFGDAVNTSSGGKISSAIENSRGGSISGTANSSLVGSAAAASPNGTAGAAGASGAAASPAGGPSATSNANMASTKTNTVPDMGKPVMPPSSDANLGDASTASLSGDSPSGKVDGNAAAGQANTSQGPATDSRKLHHKIQDLQGYVPQDQATGGGGFNIQLNHTAD